MRVTTQQRKGFKSMSWATNNVEFSNKKDEKSPTVKGDSSNRTSSWGPKAVYLIPVHQRRLNRGVPRVHQQNTPRVAVCCRITPSKSVHVHLCTHNIHAYIHIIYLYNICIYIIYIYMINWILVSRVKKVISIPSHIHSIPMFPNVLNGWILLC